MRIWYDIGRGRVLGKILGDLGRLQRLLDRLFCEEFEGGLVDFGALTGFDGVVIHVDMCVGSWNLSHGIRLTPLRG